MANYHEMTVGDDGEGLTLHDYSAGTLPRPQVNRKIIYPKANGVFARYRAANDPNYYDARLVERFFIATATNSVVNTVAETTILIGTGVEGSATTSIPGSLLQVGHTVRTYLSGYIGTDAIAPTLRIRQYASGVLLLDSGAVVMTAGLAADYWEFNSVLTFRSVGAAGSAIGQGIFSYNSALGVMTHLPMPMAVAVGGIGTTVLMDCNVTATWGTAHANNDLERTNAIQELL